MSDTYSKFTQLGKLLGILVKPFLEQSMYVPKQAHMPGQSLQTTKVKLKVKMKYKQ